MMYPGSMVRLGTEELIRPIVPAKMYSSAGTAGAEGSVGAVKMAYSIESFALAGVGIRAIGHRELGKRGFRQLGSRDCGGMLFRAMRVCRSLQ